MIGFRSVYGIFVLDMPARSAFHVALSAYIKIWLGIKVRMMLLFLEKVDVFLFCRAWRTNLESEWIINLESLWLAIMLMARSIAVTSAL